MKCTCLRGHLTVNDLTQIMGNMDVGDDLYINNAQTARNALKCVKYANHWLCDESFVTEVKFESLILERIG